MKATTSRTERTQSKTRSHSDRKTSRSKKQNTETKETKETKKTKSGKIRQVGAADSNSETVTSIPPFEVITSLNSTLRSADLLGRYSVIFFYPKNNTPGCTVENQDFTKLYDKFIKHKVQVFGATKGEVKQTCSFVDKYVLKAPILVDSDGSLCEAFAVWKKKKLYGREYWGIERSTFLFNPQGQLIHSWRSVKVDGHADQVLQTLVEHSRG